jgi:hypothetical protein
VFHTDTTFEVVGFSWAYRLERASEPKGSRAKMIVNKKRGVLLFAFSEQFEAVHVCYVFESCFD